MVVRLGFELGIWVKEVSFHYILIFRFEYDFACHSPPPNIRMEARSMDWHLLIPSSAARRCIAFMGRYRPIRNPWLEAGAIHATLAAPSCFPERRRQVIRGVSEADIIDGYGWRASVALRPPLGTHLVVAALPGPIDSVLYFSAPY